MLDRWLYFGCKDGTPGHYLWGEGMSSIWSGNLDFLNRFDALLPPQRSREGYLATISRLEGWGMTAMAWWDYSVDSRSGSNSIIFAPSLTITGKDLLAEAQRRFPVVFARLPSPVRLISIMNNGA